jgi:hypothetical protein
MLRMTSDETSPDAVPGHRDDRATRPYSHGNTERFTGLKVQGSGFKVQGSAGVQARAMSLVIKTDGVDPVIALRSE